MVFVAILHDTGPANQVGARYETISVQEKSGRCMGQISSFTSFRSPGIHIYRVTPPYAIVAKKAAIAPVRSRSEGLRERMMWHVAALSDILSQAA